MFIFVLRTSVCTCPEEHVYAVSFNFLGRLGLGWNWVGTRMGKGMDGNGHPVGNADGAGDEDGFEMGLRMRMGMEQH